MASAAVFLSLKEMPGTFMRLEQGRVSGFLEDWCRKSFLRLFFLLLSKNAVGGVFEIREAKQEGVQQCSISSHGELLTTF